MKISFESFIAERIQEQVLHRHTWGYFSDVLEGLVEIDSTPGDVTLDMSALERVSAIRRSEQQVFAVIRRELRRMGIEALHDLPISPEIKGKLSYTKPHYTITADDPLGLSFEKTYQDRSNLVVVMEGTRATPANSMIVNAHVDTVSTHIPFRDEGDILYGRGACDDKGQIALLLTQMRILQDISSRFGRKQLGNYVMAFAIDEETGGNGSLSLAMDPWLGSLARDVMVYEITENRIHAANRGALWYKVDIGNVTDRVGLGFRVVKALEELGEQIYSETCDALGRGEYAMFKPEHVQTCQGIFGNWGKHPSRVNNHVAFEFSSNAADIDQIIDGAIRQYGDHYGVELSGATDEGPHYNLTKVADSRYRLDVYGISGHMGKVRELDDAIVKAMYIHEALRDDMHDVTLAPVDPAEEYEMPGVLTIEGGQGFIPSHPIKDLMPRIRKAVEDAAREYCAEQGIDYRSGIVDVSFDKLHNDAYVCGRDLEGMGHFIDVWQGAYGLAGLDVPPEEAWRVSCDARLFAEHGFNTMVFGPGSLEQAHSDNEFITRAAVQQALMISTLATLRKCYEVN